MIPTQRQVDLMDPKDRVQLPKKIRATTSERKTQTEVKFERNMHNEFAGYLRLRKHVFGFVHANPSKRSTIAKGWPDFTVLCKVILGPPLRPRTAVCLIEFKTPGGRLSPDQVERFNELATAGIDLFICTSVGDAIDQLIEYFELSPGRLSNDK